MTVRTCGVVQGLLLFVVGLSASSYADGIIYHQAPTEAVAQEPLTLEAVIEVKDAGVVSANIYYRPRGQATYQETPMSSAGGNIYFGTIIAAEITEPGLEYYLVALLDDESVLAYPVDDPEVNPMFVAVKSAAEIAIFSPETQEIVSDLQEANVLILSPEPGEILLTEDVVIAVSFFNVLDLDASSIRLLVDRQDVTTQANVSADLVTYSPPALTTGSHQVEVHMNRTSGSAYEPVAWRFLVTREASITTEQAFRQSGTFTPAYRRDDIDGELLEVSSMKLSYRGGWEWLQFRTNVKLTSEQDPYKPHRNRFSASFRTPLLTLGIGDVTPRINRFGLDGKRMRGYDANFTLKLFNLRVVQGELERGIQGRPEAAFAVADFDPANDSLTVSRAGYAFRRDILAIRPSFGSGQRFELAFSFIKAKDNIASVDQIVENAIVEIDSSYAIDNAFDGADWKDRSLGTIYYRDLMKLSGLNIALPEKDWKGNSPQDNLVIGSSLSLALNQRRLVIQSGFALSMLNRNIWDPVLDIAGLDTLFPGDDQPDTSIAGELSLKDFPDPADFEDYFHINANQVPLLPIDPFLARDNPLKAISKMPSLAYHTTAKLNITPLRSFLTLEYQQVGPEFNSLANPNIQKNVRIRSISDRTRLFGSKLFISALYRATDDNIVKIEGDPITSTKMVNLSANLNLGRGLPSLAVGQRKYQRENGVTERDSSAYEMTGEVFDQRENMLTQSRNLGLTYRLQLLSSTHDLNLNLVNTTIGDEITDRDESFRSQNASSNILSLAVMSRLSSQLETSVVASTNKTEISGGTIPIKQKITTLDLSARLLLLNGNLRTRGGIIFRSNKTNQDENPAAPASFTQFGIKGGASFKLIENLRLVAALELRTKTLHDLTELVDLNDNDKLDPDETYIDHNENGRYDEGSYDMTLPSSIVSLNLEYTF